MRKFSFITIGLIMEELAELGLHLERRTIKRLIKRGLLTMNRTESGWYITTRKGAEKIKKLLWMNYLGEDVPYPGYDPKKTRAIPR